MAWLRDFYNRRKNPWVGLLLVLVLGPFGFLYHSWKTFLLVLFVIGPLWIIFLHGTALDLVKNQWAHYTALVLLAAVAWLQIRGKNQART